MSLHVDLTNTYDGYVAVVKSDENTHTAYPLTAETLAKLAEDSADAFYQHGGHERFNVAASAIEVGDEIIGLGIVDGTVPQRNGPDVSLIGDSWAMAVNKHKTFEVLRVIA